MSPYIWEFFPVNEPFSVLCFLGFDVCNSFFTCVFSFLSLLEEKLDFWNKLQMHNCWPVISVESLIFSCIKDIYVCIVLTTLWI